MSAWGPWTDSQQAILRGMSEWQIRHAQDLVKAQQRMAYEQKNETALERLNEWEEAYTNEMMRRLDDNG